MGTLPLAPTCAHNWGRFGMRAREGVKRPDLCLDRDSVGCVSLGRASSCWSDLVLTACWRSVCGATRLPPKALLPHPALVGAAVRRPPRTERSIAVSSASASLSAALSRLSQRTDVSAPRHTPDESEDSTGLGGGIAWAWDPKLCDELVAVTRETVFGATAASSRSLTSNRHACLGSLGAACAALTQ